MDEQRLERALRQGPPFATRYVPSSLALDARPVVRGAISPGRLVLIMAVTALLLIGMLAGLVAVGRFQSDVRPVSNGWIAFASGSGPPGPDGLEDHDIYLVREGRAAHRIVGSDADGLDQVCPAFSPDGRRIAHGEGDGAADTGYHDAALVISDLDAAGNASESLRIGVGGTFPPPCATWSADGRRVAFYVPMTYTGDPDRPTAGSGVWVATVADGHVDVLSDLLVSDLEWSPDGSLLAMSSGQTDWAGGQLLPDGGSIRLYDPDSGAMRTLVGPGPRGAWSLTWSPDGSRIAYQRGLSDGGSFDQEIWVAQVDGSGESLLTPHRFGSVYGVGPVWSPTGDRIVYQRMKGGGEAHDVVLVSPDDGSEVVLPDLRLSGDGASVSWRPSGVTWSPDGRSLLYSAWSHGEARERHALISRPLDPGADPVLLQEGVDKAGASRWWGRLPDD